jgi:hypothetical protein
VDTEEAAQRRQRETEREKQFCSYGYKFEQYMTVARPDCPSPPINCPVNENEEFCCMFSTRIGETLPSFLLVCVEDPAPAGSKNERMLGSGFEISLQIRIWIRTRNK